DDKIGQAVHAFGRHFLQEALERLDQGCQSHSIEPTQMPINHALSALALADDRSRRCYCALSPPPASTPWFRDLRRAAIRGSILSSTGKEPGPLTRAAFLPPQSDEDYLRTVRSRRRVSPCRSVALRPRCRPFLPGPAGGGRSSSTLQPGSTRWMGR